ncbi:YbhB/YbcL family Raf kinase inhibitor-like protein [Leifsonia xyli]|uniref:YbhB/YbcL family Raf kinase inhibitor-like protein n=1 Tax=Leifsonia xyli TaxID=1575 RepID=UPI003D667CD5
MALFADLAVTSPDLVPLAPIPEEYSAYGDNRIPRLEISGVPDGTVELALVCHDPDAPLPQGFTHWTVYGIPPRAGALDLDAEGVRVGPNSLGEPGWSGPMPPAGHGVHHYYFWVYALSAPVTGAPAREEFLAGYGDRVIEQARLVGTFQK